MQLIDRIEAAQLDGKLPFSARDPKKNAPISNDDTTVSPCAVVRLYFGRDGLKVVSAANCTEVVIFFVVVLFE